MAQNDTIIRSDTLDHTVTEEKPPPPVEVVEENKKQEYDYKKSGNEYFLYKWEYENDSLNVQQRKVPDEVLKKMQGEDEFWYANSTIVKPKEKNETAGSYTPLGQRQWFQTLLWLVIIGSFAAVIAIYLAGSNVGLFRKRAVDLSTGEEPDEIPEDIFAINYQKEIDKAAGNGNYRLAIRLMFLRLLKQLSEKNVLQYKQDRTNFDYLMQLQPTSYYHDFFRITRNYEYSWYGKFPVNEETYRAIREDFKRFDHQLL